MVSAELMTRAERVIVDQQWCMYLPNGLRQILGDPGGFSRVRSIFHISVKVYYVPAREAMANQTAIQRIIMVCLVFFVVLFRLRRVPHVSSNLEFRISNN